jgi:hypothetical protein
MADQVNPQDARTFLTNFGHPAEALKGMPDDQVLQLHGTVAGFHTKAVGEAVTAATSKTPVFGDKWRETLAGDNQEELKTLQRFADPGAMYKSYQAMRQKMSSGELKQQIPFPDKGTAEEQAAWRKEQGVPEKPEAYDTTLANGVVIGEEDKPLVGEFLKFAHSKHMPNAAVKETLEWFLGDYREGLEGKRAEAEASMVKVAEDQLRADWGADFRPNMNAIQGLLDANVSTQSGLKDRILKSIKLEPEFAKLWANIARQINPVSTLTGIDPARMEQSIDAELGQIKNTMRTNRAAYNADEKMQARYRELLAAKDRMKQKAA